MKQLIADLPEDLRVRALTHPAFAPSHGESYERLEFLGDSVLGLIVTEAIYRRFPDLDEGELSKVRAAVVSRDACEQIALEHGLGEVMVAQAEGRGSAAMAVATQLAPQRNALAALVESVIGASFLARGYEAVAGDVLAVFEGRIEFALNNRVDARSRLQELASSGDTEVVWGSPEETGPPHDRRFAVTANFNALQADGTGRSKQEAQQAAAAALLVLIDRDQG